MDFRIGTSGYDYSGWVGADKFYPPSLKSARRDWLTYYASQFPVAELNFTYYGETKPSQMEDMLRRTDPSQALILLEGTFSPRPDFEFVVKAYKPLTHDIDNDWRGVAARYKENIAPLREAGRLAGVLAQFTPKLRLSEKAQTYVVRLAEALAPDQLIVEFRHPSWFVPDVAARLQKYGVVYTLVDAPPDPGLPNLGLFRPPPDADSLPPPVVEGQGGPELLPADEVREALAGGRFGYVRLHGRNAGAWFGGDGVERYNYLYTPAEVHAIAELLYEELPRRSYVLFNNCHNSFAAFNAGQIAEEFRTLSG